MTPTPQPPDTAIVGLARRLADDVLFPGALETDAAETVPRARLDALAAAGLYGLTGASDVGGMGADHATTCAVVEALASGCLTTAFVWTQHLNAVRAASATTSPSVRALAGPLCSGRMRAGVALAGARAGPSSLHATRGDGGWLLEGAAQWISGWGRIDVIHTAARADERTVVWGLVEADPRLERERQALVALNATATVGVAFDGIFLPDDLVTAIVPYEDPDPAEPAKLRVHASFALGVAARATRMMGPSPLDDELVACRSALDVADAGTMPAARAQASELALRAAVALMSVVGSRSLLRAEQPQRLAREALFVSVYAARPPVRSAFLERLGVAPPG